jgi:hypothetical protein
MPSVDTFSPRIQTLIEMVDRREGETAATALSSLVYEVECNVAAMERSNPPDPGNLEASMEPGDRALRLLAARLRAAKSEIRHTHLMQARERLEAALHAVVTGEQLQESSTA